MADNNPILTVAKKMSSQMSQMAEFSRGRGELQNQSEMIDTAKAIAANGQTIVRFAGIIGDHCTDRTIRNELQYCAEMIPTLSTQLRIIATVKASTPNDSSVSHATQITVYSFSQYENLCCLSFSPRLT